MKEHEVRGAGVRALYGFSDVGVTDEIPDSFSVHTSSLVPGVRAAFKTELPPEVEEKLPPTLGSEGLSPE